MKKRLPVLCFCFAILLLLSSGLTVLLPGDHGCGAHEGCPVCLLIQAMESVLRSLWLIGATICMTISLFDIFAGRHFNRKCGSRFHETPVELCVKLSN
ncbi:MAG: hypothetical protein E7645_03225 [Ruminococcaceae bacterium]|nr:hypothetical protein [Oscillospiraceae bacterium]